VIVLGCDGWGGGGWLRREEGRVVERRPRRRCRGSQGRVQSMFVSEGAYLTMQSRAKSQPPTRLDLFDRAGGGEGGGLSLGYGWSTANSSSWLVWITLSSKRILDGAGCITGCAI
jgi:hypothetical protein